jgi:5-methylcytosine-specific restriction endonuclease McrA
MKWPPRNRVEKANRREYYKTRKDGSQYAKPNFEYQCNSCKEWFPHKDTCMDHIIPVVDPKDQNKYTEEEFIGKFVISLLSYEDNWQVLCHSCHDIKTEEENKIRQDTKKS